MALLVTGGTGTVGSQLLKRLSTQSADVRALTRDTAKAAFPDGVVPVAGDMMDVESMRSALAGVRTLFLLNAVVPQELTQAMLTLKLAQEAGILGGAVVSQGNGGFADPIEPGQDLRAGQTLNGLPEEVLQHANILILPLEGLLGGRGIGRVHGW